ncbi:hypothetical protein [Acinetobacter larvae]|uniref:Uncharacterized protein n=1 Tax=Acinetobacter larvae TaxID=1789224 RepID=A0A1B2M2C3_9GAMM|nr:hypothetical protein [Acinetobacter larvae]AOA59345.1 hypothetical protein BFG52_13925 [Acinetobacter larvae]
MPLSSSSKPIVLEQHQNIAVEPETQNNTVQLLKYPQHCSVKFTGYFNNFEVTEYWILEQGQLSRAFTQNSLDQTQHNFDIKDPMQQNNFNHLLKNFSAKHLQQCLDLK